MAGKIKLAVAGAGKTTWIAKSIDPSKYNIVISYTNKNVENIIQKINQKFDSFPKNTLVMTYDSFLYRYIIRPFQKNLKISGKNSKINNGVTINNPVEFDRENLNNGYYKNDNWRHYKDYKNRFYITRLSLLYIKQKKREKDRIKKYLDKFFDNIYIDEFQDFIGNDFKLLLDITKCKNTKIIFVGDYYQSGVSGTMKTRGINPYKKTTYDDYIKLLQDKGIDVDTHTLSGSYRCPVRTCDFIKSKLGININSKSNDNESNVFFVNNFDEMDNILNNDNIVKLFWNSKSYGYDIFSNVNRWSYSKGDTYDCTCIILTKSTSSLLNNHVKFLKNPKVLNSLYVALTRSRGDTYIISNEKLEDYLKNRVCK